MPRDDASLLDIHRALLLAIDFTGGYIKADFWVDLKTQSAVVHQLLIIGEATRRLSDEFRNKHSEIPWRYLSGMRDHLVHGYDAIDLDEVWNVLKNDLPDLLEKITPLLPMRPSLTGASIYIIPLTSPTTLQLSGGKGASLARLTAAGFPVPPGFCLTTRAYEEFVSANQLSERIQACLPAR